jgi:SNF2 family DNA or RNA helicase
VSGRHRLELEATLRPSRAPGLLLWSLAAETDSALCQAIAGWAGPELLYPSRRCQAELLLPAEAAAEALPRLTLRLARLLPLGAVLRALACTSHRRRPESEGLAPSLRAWAAATSLALELAGRGQLVPAVLDDPDAARAGWQMVLARPEDRQRFQTLAAALPPAAHCAPIGRQPTRVPSASAALLRFCHAVADLLARDPDTSPGPRAGGWPERLAHALCGPDGKLGPLDFLEAARAERLRAWAAPALFRPGTASMRTCFRLVLPPRGQPLAWRVELLLQSADDPSLMVGAAEVFSSSRHRLAELGLVLEAPQEQLLRDLGQAARLFPPLERALREARPSEVALTPDEAVELLATGAQLLEAAGFGTIVPEELTLRGHKRLRLRLRAGRERQAAKGGAQRGWLSHEALGRFRWEAALGEEVLSEAQFREIVRLKSPLVRFRDQWIALEVQDLGAMEELLAQPEARMPPSAALSALLLGEAEAPGLGLPVEVVAAGSMAERLEALRQQTLDAGGERRAAEVPVPAGLQGSLRPYQQRGLAWLAGLDELGLGACLADDMGLGKTVQLIALLLHQRSRAPEDGRPVLIVCPTSVLGNWEHELRRFAPELRVHRHYGPGRAEGAEALAGQTGPGAVVLTTYGVLRRDAGWLARVELRTLVLDEAQNIKSAESKVARAARSLQGDLRVALTGTPLENHLGELWSLFEFLTPGLLGPHEAFLRRYAVPVERHGDREAAARLRRLTAPFLMRRLKSDRRILQDLPEKHEMLQHCALSPEQATLYQAAVEASLERIGEADEKKRRVQILRMLTELKQICNHPAQYLRQSGPLAKRSGKLDRAVELLEAALADEARVLLFTQYREMGRLVSAHLLERLGIEPLFLHGGVPQRQRGEMVRAFQEDAEAPPVFVLSVKAGGTGLNLTRASVVLHYDRWWNPAVEDQATDRAYRIGQRRAVLVHKLVAQGTLEEKIGRMLEAKRALAGQVVATGERILTELDDEGLRELVALAADAVVIGED